MLVWCKAGFIVIPPARFSGHPINSLKVYFQTFTSLPVMLADACAPGYNPDVRQIEIPETSEFCISRDGDVEGAAQLYGAVHSGWGGGFVGGINGVGDIAGSVNLSGKGAEKLIRFRVDAAGELNLFHHLVCTVVKLLFCGDDAKQVNNECQQQYSNEDEYHCAEIICFCIVTAQNFADFSGKYNNNLLYGKAAVSWKDGCFA